MLGRQNDGKKRIDVSSNIKKFLIILLYITKTQ